MTSFLLIVFFIWGVGLLLTLSSFIYWTTFGNFMLASGSIASVCAYSFSFFWNSNLTFFLNLLISIIPGILLGIAFVLINRKTKPVEFLLINLVVIEIIRRLEYHLISITNGAYGVRLESYEPNFLSDHEIKFGLILLAILILILINIFLSRDSGLKCQIVGYSNISAQTMGINTHKFEIIGGIAFGLIAALAGISYVIGIGYLHPNDLSIDIGLIALAASISVLRKSFLVRIVLITIVLFVLRELLRLMTIGEALRFGFFDIFIGFVIIYLVIRISKEKVL